MPKKSSGAFNASVSALPPTPVVAVSPRGAARLKSGHPWVYRSDITAEGIPPGAVVRVTDPRGKFLGTALYSSSSQIAIRMISREEVADLPFLIAKRIRAAIAYRKQVVADTDAYRIVFSEADFLPGLIIDRYSDVLSVQILTQAMDAEPVRGVIVETLLRPDSSYTSLALSSRAQQDRSPANDPAESRDPELAGPWQEPVREFPPAGAHPKRVLCA